MANEYYHINWVLSNIIKRKIVAMFIVTSGESLTLYKTRYVTNIIHVCKSKMKWCNLQVVSTLGPRASGASELRCVPRAWCPDHDVTEAGTAAAGHGGGA